MENLNFEDICTFFIAIFIMSSPLWIAAFAYFMGGKYGHQNPYINNLLREMKRIGDEIVKISEKR